MRRETRTEELKANRQFLLMALVKTKVKATWVVCVALCILPMTMPSASARDEERMYLSLLQFSSYHHGLICAWFTTVGTICNPIQGGGVCQLLECARECALELNKRKEASHSRANCETLVRPQECCCTLLKNVPLALANNVGRTVVVGEDGFLGR
jgi:hypothetical protein